MNTLIKLSLLATISLISITSFSQKKELSENQMLRGEKTNITTSLPQVIEWIDDSHFLINKKVHPDSSAKLFVVDCKTGILSPSIEETKKSAEQTNISVSIRNNDIFLNETGKSAKQLTNSKEIEINPTLSPDNKYVGFTRNNDLFTIDVLTGKENRITTDGTDLILNGYASWVYYEEILGRGSRYRSFYWSPDSKNICYMRMDDTKVPLFPIYNESGQHGFTENTRYPKSGDNNPGVRIGIASADGGKTTWADFDESEDQYFGLPYWTPDSKKVFVQWMNRGQNNLKIYSVDPMSGGKKEIYSEEQKTWIDLDDQGKRITFLGNKGFLLMSDKDGWDQIYFHNPDGSLRNKISSGEHWSTSIEYIDSIKNIIYFSSRKENSTRVDFYRADLDGKNQQRLTFGDYTHSIDISPNGTYFITRYSNASTPDRLAVLSNKGKLILELGDSKGAAFEEFTLSKTEIIRIVSEDGLFQLPIRITWPINYDAGKKYPVMINIYGGPNAGTVRDGWQYNGQSQWWAKEGLIQVAIDHRASGHFGKNGVNYMHRNLGKWEVNDWITIVKWLRQNGADSNRVGIAGFSYGGYMTCMALTAGAGYFTHGLAGGSVTDWRLYDSHYTERFMDTPKENPAGYDAGSVMSYVDKYKGLLRIYHGTMDDNVHMQNSIQLVKKLQESKKHFEFMLYPGGRHGWGGAQQSHSSNENNMFIYKNLLQKPMPEILVR